MQTSVANEPPIAVSGTRFSPSSSSVSGDGIRGGFQRCRLDRGDVPPGAVERRYDVTFKPWQRTYLEYGDAHHAVGMLGPYDDIWWWDHVTHTHSATILGGVTFAAARRRGRDPRLWVVAIVACAGCTVGDRRVRYSRDRQSPRTRTHTRFLRDGRHVLRPRLRYHRRSSWS